MSITQFTEALPSADDPATFDARANALMLWLTASFAPELNLTVEEIATALAGAGNLTAAVAQLQEVADGIRGAAGFDVSDDPDLSVDPGLLAIRSNVLQAILTAVSGLAEGAPGAPRVLGRAVIPEDYVIAEFAPLEVVAADTHAWEHGAGLNDSMAGSTATVLSSGSSWVLAQSYTVLGYTGTARVKFQQYGAAGENGTYYSELRVNGVPAASWSIDYSTSGQLRTQDVTVAPGDVIEIYHRDTGSVHGHRPVGIYSDRALYRLGALTTRG
ncbi:MAG: hypothetical protein PHX82_06115 [Paracoccaceae bacterium]|nr:hypothetical protein [Paracoccaceae bacterium]